MEFLECKYDFNSVETGSFLIEKVVFSEMVEQFAAIEEVHHKVESVRGLERVVQFDDERGVHMLQDQPLN